jgi:hypothetical protein
MEDNSLSINQDSCLICKIIFRQLIKILVSNMEDNSLSINQDSCLTWKIIVLQVIKILVSNMEDNSLSINQDSCLTWKKIIYQLIKNFPSIIEIESPIQYLPLLSFTINETNLVHNMIFHLPRFISNMKTSAIATQTFSDLLNSSWQFQL